MVCAMLLVLAGSVNAIRLWPWDTAPYNMMVGNAYTDLEGITHIQQRIAYGDCEYPSGTIVIGDAKIAKITRNYINIELKENAEFVSVGILANSKTRCSIGTKYLMEDGGWKHISKHRIYFEYDYYTDWKDYLKTKTR